VTGNTELVPIGISKVSAIVVLVILGPQPWRTFRFAAVGESNPESLIYDFSAFGEKRDHVAVTWLRRALVIWLTNQEEGPRARRGLPTCPWAASLTEARFNTKCFHQWVVERECAFKVADADEDM
jgi:hypothetical protein